MKLKTTLTPLLFSLLLLSCACKQGNSVLVIEKTHTYHTDKCAQVKMARTARATILEARQESYQACPYCKPDQQR